MTVLRSLAFYLLFYSASVVFVLGSVAALVFPPHISRKVPDGWAAFHRWCVVHVLGIKVVIEGERVAGPALYALKHETMFDAIDAPALFHQPVVFAKAELFRIPGWGRAARAYGAVPVAREQGAMALRTMIGEARRFASEGRPLVIFPEGTRVPHGEVAPLRSGFAGLYKMLALSVIPVAIDSGRTYAGTWKRRGTISIRFGEPIPPGLPREEVEARVLREINALNG
ncbi:MAG TPA: lysophospholipid acyltransferase family protein [Croceibacterium sp.]|nr:lysophospholipid acyltransferase family protein [Croceibacterium sp.]